MKMLNKVPLFLVIMLFLSFGGCDTGDDNNPSPVPDARDKYTGTWAVNNESCGKSKYQVIIEKDPSNSAQALIRNFGFSSAAEPDTAIVAGNSIVVYQQYNSEGWLVQGQGSYQDNGDIKWTYSLTISGFLENCTATYTPQ